MRQPARCRRYWQHFATRDTSHGRKPSSLEVEDDTGSHLFWVIEKRPMTQQAAEHNQRSQSQLLDCCCHNLCHFCILHGRKALADSVGRIGRCGSSGNWHCTCHFAKRVSSAQGKFFCLCKNHSERVDALSDQHLGSDLGATFPIKILKSDSLAGSRPAIESRSCRTAKSTGR